MAKWWALIDHEWLSDESLNIEWWAQKLKSWVMHGLYQRWNNWLAESPIYLVLYENLSLKSTLKFVACFLQQINFIVHAFEVTICLHLLFVFCFCYERVSVNCFHLTVYVTSSLSWTNVNRSWYVFVCPLKCNNCKITDMLSSAYLSVCRKY